MPERAKPISDVTFKIESMDEDGTLSVTGQTGTDGTLTITEADGLTAGQYKITELDAPSGYVSQTESQIVTVLPGGDGSIRKVDADARFAP